MNIILIHGGLGNQMSQYAFFIAKKVYTPRTIFNSYIERRQNAHYGYELERVFGIPDNKGFIIDSIVRYTRKLLYLKDKPLLKYLIRSIIFISNTFGIHLILDNEDLKFDQRFLEIHAGLNVYSGTWLSEKYFKEVEVNIKNIFSFDLNKLNKQSRSIINRIKTCNSVSLHVRRGDFMEPFNITKHGNVCSLNYYYDAIKYICAIIESPCFFVFSDDIMWVKENLHLNNAVFIDWNTGYDSWQDMCLISLCKHNINANSTFSWWGAWLNNNPQKIVIVPRFFLCGLNFSDDYPENWIKL
jgi:hypothetical protein